MNTIEKFIKREIKNKDQLNYQFCNNVFDSLCVHLTDVVEVIVKFKKSKNLKLVIKFIGFQNDFKLVFNFTFSYVTLIRTYPSFSLMNLKYIMKERELLNIYHKLIDKFYLKIKVPKFLGYNKPEHVKIKNFLKNDKVDSYSIYSNGCFKIFTETKEVKQSSTNIRTTNTRTTGTIIYQFRLSNPFEVIFERV